MRGVMFAVIPSPLFAIVLADDTVLSARVKPRFLRQVETPNSPHPSWRQADAFSFLRC